MKNITVGPKMSRCAGGGGDWISERWSKFTMYMYLEVHDIQVHVFSTSKCVIFAHIHDVYIHVCNDEKVMKNVSMFAAESHDENTTESHNPSR